MAEGPSGAGWVRLRSYVVTSALAALLLHSPAAAQTPGRFEGRLVAQETGVPVAGASVSIPGMTGSARTDDDGGFTWTPVPQVPFQIIVVLSSGQVARPVVVEEIRSAPP